MKKILVFVISVVIVCTQTNSSFAQEQKDTLSVLFVGNSYTYVENMPHLVSIISNKSKTKIITKKSVIGGAKLREHWHGERGLKTKEIIKNGQFDIVVLQQFSMGTINEPDSMLKYSRLFCDLIKENNAKPYLYLTWAREKVPQYQEIINDVYSKAAEENDAIIAPVGKVWERAQQLRPTIKLFDADGSHPSELGAFLTACVFVKIILNELSAELQNSFSTTDREGETIRLMHIDPLDAVFCKKVVEEILQSQN